LDNLRPFTGHYSLQQEKDWADQLGVLSAEERQEYEDEEDENKDDEHPKPPVK